MAAPEVLAYISAGGIETLLRQADGWRPGEPAQALQRRAVVTNLIDESYLALEVPKLRGADRKSFIDLQLAHRFPDTPLRAVLPFKATAARDRLILTGVGNEQAESAIRELVDAGVELTGVWSLPTLLMDALVKARRKLPQALLATVPTRDGLRLLFVLDGQPSLTRLLPANLGPEAQNQDIIATRRYLEDSRVIERGTPLALLALDGEAAQVEALAGYGFKPLAPPWRAPRQGSQLDRLLDLALHAAPGQLAPDSMRERFHVRRLRTAMVAMTAGCVGMAALAGMHTAQDTVAQWAALSRLDDAVATQRTLIQTHTRALDQLGVDAGLLLAARRLQEMELRPTALPPRALHLLAQTLQAEPGMALEHLAWRRTALDTACPQENTLGLGTPAATDATAPNPTATPAMAAPDAMPPGTPEPAAAAPRLGLEVQLAFQAPRAEAPLAVPQWRRRLAERLAAWPDARLLRGGELADANQALSGGPRGGGSQGGGGASSASGGQGGQGDQGGPSGEALPPLSFCLVLAEPAAVAP